MLVTPWEEYRTIDFEVIREKLRGNLVFDTANLWNSSEVELAGLQYVNIGGGKLFGS